MGKQGRRKQRQKRKQQGGTGNSKQQAKDPVNPASAVHQLRHADAKTRHAALVALQATVLHPSSKQVSLSVLQAIREQVMDNNLECASAAAECLAQYLSFACHYPEQTASWTLVFMGRLDTCHRQIQQKTNLKQWYALAAPCLRALCKLIEVNELALNQLNLQKQTFLTTIFGLLQDTIEFEGNNDDRITGWVCDTGIYAARMLHSALDDNDEMASIINISSQNDKLTYYSVSKI